MAKDDKGRSDKNLATQAAPQKGPGAPNAKASGASAPARPASDDAALRALEALRAAFEGLRADVSGLTGRLASEGVVVPIRDALARELREDVLTAARASHESVAQGLATLGVEQRARLDLVAGLVDEVRARLVEGDVRMVALDARVTEARIAEAVRDAVAAKADRVFQEQFQSRLDELTGAFADADDRFGQLRAYIDQFGPGGLPVVKQENAELQARLDALGQEAHGLRKRVAELEAAAIRQRVEHGIDPVLVDERLRKIEEKDRSIADRESLGSENRRLLVEIDKLKEEVARWVGLGLREQEDRAQKAYIARLERESNDAHEARTRAETDRVRADRYASDREREAEQLRQALTELEADRAAARERAARLEALTQENHGLTRQYEEEASESAELRLQLRDAQNEMDRRERRILEMEAARTSAEIAWRRTYAEEQRAGLERVRGELTKWASETAAIQATAARAETDRLAKEGDTLRGRVEELTRRLSDVERARDEHVATIRRLELDRAALEMAAERHKTLLDGETAAHRARLEQQLADDAEAIRAEAADLGERERKAAMADADELTRVADKLQERVNDLDDERARLHATLAELGGQKGELEGQLEGLRQRIHDLQVRDIPAAERIGSLRKHWFPPDELKATDAPDEGEWLASLGRGIAEAGFLFHPRLLRAFHTSLKIAHHAPLTVLAGISGTGKSELPRLYADLGGLPFLELAVQPSWDSPHDLFGFFNYTDGRLKAEPLAQMLAQVSESEGALRRSPILVLLDEMNLARVEYYFADLLSKLEARRGVRRFGDDAARLRASVLIDAGPGEPKIPLYLDERVMFAGTMNQDESTLTLSDKVLDRACLLTFPAPRTLEMREQKRVTRRPQRLSWDAWTGWAREPVGSDEHTRKLNELNEIMGKVERPFGHRLFRAIHAYVANYPAGGDPDHAWSDQFAMKVLPRLRGLECGDRKVRQGLADLAALVPGELQESFDVARDREFFTWSGAAELYRADP